MELTVHNLNAVMRDALASNPANAGAILVEGVVNRFAFDPAGLERQRANIDALLAQLPEQFHAGSGDGWSFLNACQRRDGLQWTGLHRDMEALFAVGMAAGRVRECFPRDLWPALHGGMPYYRVTEREAYKEAAG